MNACGAKAKGLFPRVAVGTQWFGWRYGRLYDLWYITSIQTYNPIIIVEGSLSYRYTTLIQDCVGISLSAALYLPRQL